MIKKLLSVVTLVLALNFLGVVAGTAWVWKSGHVDKEKLKQLKLVLYPADSQPATEPATEPATTEPVSRLDELLAKSAGRPASEQIQFIKDEFAGEMAELDRQRRELLDLRHQDDLAREQAADDRAKVEQARAALAQQKAEQEALKTDKGFQDSLALYEIMPTKQVKTIFMTLGEATVVAYLDAMPPARAAKIIKEFKSPEETDRIQKVLERLRVPPTTAPAGTTAGTPAGPAF
jgi:hypothetical protein